MTIVDVIDKSYEKKYWPDGNIQIDEVKKLLEKLEYMLHYDGMTNDVSLDSEVYAEKKLMVACQIMANEIIKHRDNAVLRGTAGLV